MTLKTYCRINPKFLLIKLHYFFMYGGFGGSLPYGILLGKSLNINGTAIGMSLIAFRILVLVSGPLIGSLVDYYQNIKIFLIGILVAKTITGLSLLLIPPITIEYENKDIGFLNFSESKISIQPQEPRECLKSFKINCTFTYEKRNISELSVNDTFESTSFLPMNSNNLTFQVPNNYSRINDNDPASDTPFHDNANANNMKRIVFESRNFSDKCKPNMHVYTSYQFWLFTMLFTILGVCSANAYPLSDVACYEILGSDGQLYGSQRLFGTIGWAIVCFISGFLNDILSERNSRKDYSPGFYLMAILVAVDLLIISKMPKFKPKSSKNISGDLKRVFGSSEIILFAVGTVFMGIFSVMVRNYEFWYLQDMGASQTLMGATVSVQCSIEIPFFLISAWFIRKCGSFNCLVLCFVAFSIRSGMYSLMHNPWWALAIDTTHGITFALFHFAMTNFASTNAPEGTEASVLGILLGLDRGLGSVAGNLIGGVALDKYGGRLMFLFASVLSAACAISFAILPRFIKKRNSKTEKFIRTEDRLMCNL